MTLSQRLLASIMAPAEQTLVSLPDSIARRLVPEKMDQLIDRPLFSIGSTPVSAATLAAFGVVLALSWFVAVLLQRATVRGLSVRGKADPATVSFVARLVNYVVLLLGFGIALQTVGISLTAVFAAGAFFAVALGFAMQNVAENFVSGIILMTERTIKLGDVLRIEGTVVRVTRIGLRATVVRSRDEEDMIVPNSVLVRNTVTNFTLRDSIIRVKATVGVAYSSDVPFVRQVLHDAAGSLKGRSPDMEPLVLLTGFGNSSIDFEISVWGDEPWNSRRLLSALNEQIWAALKANGITIPFPQRDVHMISSAQSPE